MSVIANVYLTIIQTWQNDHLTHEKPKAENLKFVKSPNRSRNSDWKTQGFWYSAPSILSSWSLNPWLHNQVNSAPHKVWFLPPIKAKQPCGSILHGMRYQIKNTICIQIPPVSL